MAKIPALKRIVKEDFGEEYQELIEGIAYPFNTSIEAILQALTKGINFENLSWQYKELTFQVRADGTLGSDVYFKQETKGNPLGMQIIFVSNLTSPGTPLTTAPFAQYSVQDGLIKISNITGLAANNRYTIRLVIFS